MHRSLIVVYVRREFIVFVQINVEPNHTTLAGHSYEHDVVLASA